MPQVPPEVREAPRVSPVYYGYRCELEDLKGLIEVLMKEVEVLSERVLRLEEELGEVLARLAQLEGGSR